MELMIFKFGIEKLKFKVYFSLIFMQNFKLANDSSIEFIRIKLGLISN